MNKLTKKSNLLSMAAAGLEKASPITLLIPDNTLCTGTCRSSDHFNVLHVINRLGRIKGLLRNIDKMYPHCFICIAILFKHIVTHMAHSPSSASNVLYNSVVLLPCVP